MDKIVDRLLADRAVTWFKDRGADKSEDPENSSGWVTKAIMALIVVAFLAYLAYKANSRSKELAKLKHNRDVAKEEEKQAKLDWELAELDKDIEDKMNMLIVIGERRAALDKELEVIEEEVEYEGFKIEAIDNWDDMDAYLDTLRAERPS
jgi:septal ring factor EnvC (AmiA/AmiB activator)